MNDVTELLNSLREAIANRDNQIDGLVKERDRLRGVVRKLQEERADDNKKISDLLVKVIDLSEIVKEWLSSGRFLAGNSEEKKALVERSKMVLEEKK